MLCFGFDCFLLLVRWRLSLWPVAAFAYQISQLLQPGTVNVIKSVLDCAVDIDNGDHLFVHYNWHNDLAAAVPIASDMPRESIHVRHKLRLPRCCSSSANAPPKRDGLACYFALERAEDELWVGCCREGIERVEAGPVDCVGWRREGFIGVPEEGGGVGEVAGKLVCLFPRAMVFLGSGVKGRWGGWVERVDRKMRPVRD
jgi:hypothetical protein